MTVLSKEDLCASSWHKLKRHYEGRLSELRNRNDADLTPDQTARLRGRIAECKYFLGLGEESPKPTTEEFADDE